jgi:hypothetical protein
MLMVAAPCIAGPLDTAAGNGVVWLSQQRNAVDGSWGTGDAVKFVNTAEAVQALGALNQLNGAYYAGLAWLGNHAGSNVDYAARRVLALGAAKQSVASDLAFLQLNQKLTAPGNSGWGLSVPYQGSPLDTALALQAMNQQGVTSNVAQAVTYLMTSQIAGSDSGWAVSGQTASDPVTTAQVLLALIPLKGQYASVPTAVARGLTALNTKVGTNSPAHQIGLAVVANLRNDPSAAQGVTLLNALIGQQAANGSWGGDAYVTAIALRAIATGAGKELAAQKQLVSLPDNALRAAINDALGQSSLDAISVGQMQSLTTLTASGLGLTNLTGLQYATNLTYLDVSNNNIASFAPLAGLANLTVVGDGNPGYAAGGDVPTLPQWAAILLGLVLLMQGAQAHLRRSRAGDRS